MEYEIKIGNRDPARVMQELEDYLTRAEISGEGDLPIWIEY